MKQSIKQRRHDEALANLLGITYEEVLAQRKKEDNDDKVREAQAVLLFLEKPDAFIEKVCSNCKGSFLTTYQFVSLCSTHCRIVSLEQNGIEWNPMRTAEERWKRAKIPTGYVIPPAALKVLIELAKHFQEQQFENPLTESDLHSEQQLDEPVEEIPSIEPSYNGVQTIPESEQFESIPIEEEDWMQ